MRHSYNKKVKYYCSNYIAKDAHILGVMFVLLL